MEENKRPKTIAEKIDDQNLALEDIKKGQDQIFNAVNNINVNNDSDKQPTRERINYSAIFYQGRVLIIDKGSRKEFIRDKIIFYCFVGAIWLLAAIGFIMASVIRKVVSAGLMGLGVATVIYAYLIFNLARMKQVEHSYEFISKVPFRCTLSPEKIIQTENKPKISLIVAHIFLYLGLNLDAANVFGFLIQNKKVEVYPVLDGFVTAFLIIEIILFICMSWWMRNMFLIYDLYQTRAVIQNNGLKKYELIYDPDDACHIQTVEQYKQTYSYYKDKELMIINKFNTNK